VAAYDGSDEIGYKTWADGKENIMPEVTYVYDDNASKEKYFRRKTVMFH
jgi:hypothetical protein